MSNVGFFICIQEYEEESSPRAPLETAPSYKEEEYEDASPKAHLPIPEELPPPPPEPAVVEPVGDLLVIFKLKFIF